MTKTLNKESAENEEKNPFFADMKEATESDEKNPFFSDMIDEPKVSNL